MKHVISLDNGARVEIDGIEVKHIDAVGNVLYDTVNASTVKNVRALPYFFLMGEPESEKVTEWLGKVNPNKDEIPLNHSLFIHRVQRALKVINYDYYIATLEPSFDKDVNIFYKKGKPVARGISLGEWKKRATAFYSDGEWHSELAMLEEGDLFKAYRIAMGYWTIEYVCDDSSSAGNYLNAPKSVYEIEASGEREVGGFRDGIGNTYEIYQTEESAFVLVGGSYNDNGDRYPVAETYYYYNKPNLINRLGSGVLVLKRDTQ